MEYLKIAAVVWPVPMVLAVILILKNVRLSPAMETAFYVLLGLVFIVAAFVMLSRFFTDPPDQSHPD
jgi:hypothetical protein